MAFCMRHERELAAWEFICGVCVREVGAKILSGEMTAGELTAEERAALEAQQRERRVELRKQFEAGELEVWTAEQAEQLIEEEGLS